MVCIVPVWHCSGQTLVRVSAISLVLKRIEPVSECNKTNKLEPYEDLYFAKRDFHFTFAAQQMAA